MLKPLCLATLGAVVITATLIASTPAAHAQTAPVQGGDPAAVAEAARQGDFAAVDAAASSSGEAAADAVIDAQRALTLLDYDGVAAALQRYERTGDTNAGRGALAAAVEGEAAFAQGHYARAATALERQAAFASQAGDTRAAAELSKTLVVARLLADVAPQTIMGMAEDVRTTLDEAGLTRAPTQVNGRPIDMVVDTGANLSVLSAAAAARLGVRVIEGDAAIGSSTQETVAARLGVAETVRLGGFTVSNVVFIVLDDAQLTFPNGYAIDGIVGFPLFQAAGGMTILDDGRMRLEPPPASPYEAPLRMTGNDLFVGVELNGEPLSLHLDTGASDTTLSALYVSRHAPELADADRRASTTGGAGGVVTGHVTSLRNATLEIGDAVFDMPSLDVELASGGRAPKWVGTLGQDVLGRVELFGFDLLRMKFVVGPPRQAARPR